LIARAPGALVSSEGKVRVTLFAIFAHNFRVVVLILDKILLSFGITLVNVNLSKSIVKFGLLVSLFRASFKPLIEHAHLAPALKLLNKFLNGSLADGNENLLDVSLLAIHIEKCSQNFGSSVRVDSEKVNFNTFQLLSVEKVTSKLLSVIMFVAQVNQSAGILEFAVHQEITGLNGIVVISFLNDAFDFFKVAKTSA
jgi:hypothetical protein